MKKKPLPLMLFLSLMLLITAAAPVFGAEAAAVTEEAARKPIRIGYMDYGSFIELDETGEYTGFGVEFLEEISNYTGWTYEYVYDTWANLLTRLKNHDIDFLGTPQKTLEREEIYDFADQWSGVEQTIIYTRLGNSDIYKLLACLFSFILSKADISRNARNNCGYGRVGFHLFKKKIGS